MIVHVTDFPLIERMWPTLEPMFEKVTRLTNGRFEPRDVLVEIMAGEQQLWVAYDKADDHIDAVMTTSICTYPRRKAIRVVYVSGKRMNVWLAEFIEYVEQFAKREGATLIEGFFRRGWGKVWPGARENGVGFCKDLAV